MPQPTVRVGHSPDPDDAFMFYALTFPQFDTSPEVYEHHLIDIETLNRDAEKGKYEVTALSFHAYAYVADKYILLPHGASFGDNYGPMIVAKKFDGKADASGADARKWLEGKTIAIPGKRTSAYLALNIFSCGINGQPARPSTGDLISRRDTDFFRCHFNTVVVPFDQIIPRVAAGEFDGGLIIHEGQLTYHEENSGALKKVVDLGEWWGAKTGLPLPLGGNGIRRDLGADRIKRISRHLHDSIKWGLDHRDEALSYALKYARDMGKDKADKFVGMYVNDYTLDYGEKGRAAVRRFLDEGRRLGLITIPAQPEWTE
ncbi:MAG TPA: MqnA/MqnD/SBP family protein [Planctomycetota bacterium]|nr:MqnA/MqnD/SBP family protein [Planctomycetota bacterium]